MENPTTSGPLEKIIFSLSGPPVLPPPPPLFLRHWLENKSINSNSSDT